MRRRGLTIVWLRSCRELQTMSERGIKHASFFSKFGKPLRIRECRTALLPDMTYN
jgi:hypothetical protein